jgi:hypothetical protein
MDHNFSREVKLRWAGSRENNLASGRGGAFFLTFLSIELIDLGGGILSYRLLVLKNYFSQNWRKQNCMGMRFKRSFRIPRHFASPNFRPFDERREFFNTHAC